MTNIVCNFYLRTSLGIPYFSKTIAFAFGDTYEDKNLYCDCDKTLKVLNALFKNMI